MLLKINQYPVKKQKSQKPRVMIWLMMIVGVFFGVNKGLDLFLPKVNANLLFSIIVPSILIFVCVMVRAVIFFIDKQTVEEWNKRRDLIIQNDARRANQHIKLVDSEIQSCFTLPSMEERFDLQFTSIINQQPGLVFQKHRLTKEIVNHSTISLFSLEELTVRDEKLVQHQIKRLNSFIKPLAAHTRLFILIDSNIFKNELVNWIKEEIDSQGLLLDVRFLDVDMSEDILDEWISSKNYSNSFFLIFSMNLSPKPIENSGETCSIILLSNCKECTYKAKVFRPLVIENDVFDESVDHILKIRKIKPQDIKYFWLANFSDAIIKGVLNFKMKFNEDQNYLNLPHMMGNLGNSNFWFSIACASLDPNKTKGSDFILGTDKLAPNRLKLIEVRT